MREQEQVGQKTKGVANYLPEIGSVDEEILNLAAEIFFGTKYPFLDDTQRAALFGQGGDDSELELFLGFDTVLRNAKQSPPEKNTKA